MGASRLHHLLGYEPHVEAVRFGITPNPLKTKIAFYEQGPEPQPGKHWQGAHLIHIHESLAISTRCEKPWLVRVELHI